MGHPVTSVEQQLQVTISVDGGDGVAYVGLAKDATAHYNIHSSSICHWWLVLSKKKEGMSKVVVTFTRDELPLVNYDYETIQVLCEGTPQFPAYLVLDLPSQGSERMT